MSEHSQKLTTMDTRMAMWQMRIQGVPVNKIADEFGVSVRHVRYELRDAVRLIDATKWLEVETQTDLDRLERLFQAYWPEAVTEKNMDAAHLVLKILDQKAKLLGLNAPKRVDISLLIAQWAELKGINIDDAIDVTSSLFPRPEVKA